MGQLTLSMDPQRAETRVMLMEGRNERLRAVLGPLSSVHPRAAATLLEGLALWHQRPLSVVLCADVGEASCVLNLTDGLGLGERNVHYEVELALRDHRRRGRRLAGLGDFRDLRQLCLEAVES
jgi:hypothetical protein